MLFWINFHEDIKELHTERIFNKIFSFKIRLNSTLYEPNEYIQLKFLSLISVQAYVLIECIPYQLRRFDLSIPMYLKPLSQSKQKVIRHFWSFAWPCLKHDIFALNSYNDSISCDHVVNIFNTCSIPLFCFNYIVNESYQK